MAVAGQYKPMRSKVVKNKIPVEIIRCVDSDGNYVLVKKYESGRKQSRRRYHHRTPPITTFEHEPCKLDIPAKFKLSHGIAGSYCDPNKDYTVQMIKYCIDKQNTNEYELRNLVMTYLKSMRKEMDKDKFRDVCNIFDKADKMLMRCDRRKNSNINEANVSYKFLIKSYKRIVELCEVKKKVYKTGDLHFKYLHRRGYGFTDDIIDIMEMAVFMIQNGAIYNNDYMTQTTCIYDYSNYKKIEISTHIFKNYINQFYRGVFA